MSVAYYNEHDPHAAAWLRNLIAAGHIAPGYVDERSIADVVPTDLLDFTQCHFFAGIGVWSYALRRAGWPDERVAWSGSCPCQPFSASGRRQGFDDERHLWPAWFQLICQHRPPVVFGEQVDGKAAAAWLDLVHSDMEAIDYAFAAGVFPAAGVGAPHRRHRTYFVADTSGARAGRHARAIPCAQREGQGEWFEPRSRVDGDVDGRTVGELVLPVGSRLEGHGGHGDDGHQPGWDGAQSGGSASAPSGSVGVLADGSGDGWREERPIGGWSAEGDRTEGIGAGLEPRGGLGELADDRSGGRDTRLARNVRGQEGAWREDWHVPDRYRSHAPAGPTNGFWRDPDWLFCRDERWRPVEPGTFPLAHGSPSRVGRLRAYGNAICAPQAEEFIRAYMECRP